MNIYNTTADVIEDRYNGFSFVVGPDKTLSVSDDAGAHLMRRQARNGLVCLDYGSKEEEKFGSLKEFKKHKKKEGLKAYKEWTAQCMSQEKHFPKEVNMRNGGDMELSTTRVPFFTNKIKEIDNLLKQAEDDVEGKSIDKIEAKKEISKEIMKRRGRRPKDSSMEAKILGGIEGVDTSAITI